MLFRESILEKLQSWFNVDMSLFPEIVWISGRSSVGKTLILSAFCSTFSFRENFRLVEKDCLLFASFKELVCDICVDVFGVQPTTGVLELLNLSCHFPHKTLLVLDHCDNMIAGYLLLFVRLECIILLKPLTVFQKINLCCYLCP